MTADEQRKILETIAQTSSSFNLRRLALVALEQQKRIEQLEKKLGER